ncbi:hypothetical protein ABFB09_09045 [Dehalogenimonas sp. THU2]|uniref:hypothetical protein n=1 Tax=Dehalogenimonas sp. THU2 TaxID=3151121 RepID=UPI0032189691
MELIIEALNGKDTHGFNVDSIFYHSKQGWVVIEFLRCETVRPHESSPNRYWNRCWRKVTALWKLTENLDGQFYWVTFEDSRKQFSILHITGVDKDHGITFSRTNTDFKGFCKWYNELNDNPGKLW